MAAHWQSVKLLYLKKKKYIKRKLGEWKCFPWLIKSQFVLQQAGGSVSEVRAGRQSVMVCAVLSWHTWLPLIASLGCHSVPRPRCCSGAATSVKQSRPPRTDMAGGREGATELTCSASCSDVKQRIKSPDAWCGTQDEGFINNIDAPSVRGLAIFSRSYFFLQDSNSAHCSWKLRKIRHAHKHTHKHTHTVRTLVN